ncbi:MAG: Hsp20/alpha crystallin family protein [Bacteroidia bacterium]|nr:Hsp20/alpha crystallin family protein [Bacteroidia bacterium]
MTLVKFNRNRFAPVFPALFSDFFGRDLANWDQDFYTQPAVNVKETETGFQLEVAAPGMGKDDFRVELDQDVLTISSRKEASHEEKNGEGRYTRREFRYQAFTRRFTLPDNVDAEKIQAKYEHGVLHLTLPKREAAVVPAARQIEIS